MDRLFELAVVGEGLDTVWSEDPCERVYHEGTEYKWCFSCSYWVTVSLFPANSNHKDKLDGRCKPCINKQASMRKLLEKYRAPLLEIQNNRCACCGREFRSAAERVATLDHDHDTGELRGLICKRCNLVLGKVKDDADILIALARYLEEGGTKEAKDLTNSVECGRVLA